MARKREEITKTNIIEMFFCSNWITFYKSFDVSQASLVSRLGNVIEVTSEKLLQMFLLCLRDAIVDCDTSLPQYFLILQAITVENWKKLFNAPANVT